MSGQSSIPLGGSTPFQLDLPPKGRIHYHPYFIALPSLFTIYQAILKEIDLKQGYIRLFGKTMKEPRLSAWLSDWDYTYSNQRQTKQSWTKTTKALLLKINEFTGCEFNSCLINFYRDGNDSMGYHQDNEKELGTNPNIASLSLGAKRRFLVKKDKAIPILLENGSLLLMAGDIQHHYKHSLPKMKNQGPRLNLTFRKILF